MQPRQLFLPYFVSFSKIRYPITDLKKIVYKLCNLNYEPYKLQSLNIHTQFAGWRPVQDLPVRLPSLRYGQAGGVRVFIL